tara:strand:+ start:1738 stop:1857 length:120 start_codon:yes stop_codon:yes gene_type:complete
MFYMFYVFYVCVINFLPFFLFVAENNTTKEEFLELPFQN